MESLWESGERAQIGRGLDEDIRTDVLVIGAGLTGVLCAYALHAAGVDVALVEADEFMGGVSGRTTAKVTAQHGLVYRKLIRSLGRERARSYLEANLAAIEKYRELARWAQCGFEERDAYVYATKESPDMLRELENESAALKSLGYEVELTDAPGLPFEVAGALKFPDQAQLNPVRLATALARDLRIYTHTPVRELVGTTAVTDGGAITAENIIVATHFPFINRHGSYFLKMYQQRSYVLALEGAPLVNAMYIDAAENGLSFRDSGELLLLGGGGHRTGKSGGNWKVLEHFAERYYPGARVKYRWATQDCMTLDAVPYIGEYSARTEGLYVATGFNKWGMTSAMVAAQLLCDLIMGRDNPYARLFSPSRTILRPQLAVNAWEALTGWLTPTRRRCPHLGCALTWNAAEHTWDCPCHGSRFEADGQLLENPAVSAGRWKG